MKKLIILVFLLTVSRITASDVSEIREVLKHVETDHNPSAIGDGGDSWGILQIQKGVIIDINRKYGTDYTHQDAFDIVCAEEIFELYIEMWTEKLEKRENREATEFDIVRIWNGGPRGYQKEDTLKYLKKYQKYKEKLRMEKRKCLVNGKLGMVLESHTHTMDVLIFEGRRKVYGINKNYVKILPSEAKPAPTSQLTMQF